MIFVEGNLAKMTSKGQITIPKDIRDKMNAKKGDYFLFELKGNNKVEIKKAELSTSEKFEKVAQRIQKKFEEHGITRKDVEEAIRWARSQEK